MLDVILHPGEKLDVLTAGAVIERIVDNEDLLRSGLISVSNHCVMATVIINTRRRQLTWRG
ncbi:MAG: hypothetical protein OWU33_09480 [Firmicutes bacterium]|nr:hypothetical protein [Bacillota bacterium]